MYRPLLRPEHFHTSRESILTLTASGLEFDELIDNDLRRTVGLNLGKTFENVDAHLHRLAPLRRETRVVVNPAWLSARLRPGAQAARSHAMSDADAEVFDPDTYDGPTVTEDERWARDRAEGHRRLEAGLAQARAQLASQSRHQQHAVARWR